MNSSAPQLDTFGPSSIQEAFGLLEHVPTKELSLPSYRPWTDDELIAVIPLADLADRRGVSLVVRAPHPDLCIQIDVHRLHRRLLVEGRNLEALDSFRTCEPEDHEALAEVVRFRQDPDHVLAILRRDPIGKARTIFEWIVQAEDSLYVMNLVRPYRDLVPIVLQRLEPTRTACLLEGLNPGYAARVFCDDYTRVSPEILGAVVQDLPLEFSTRVIRTMLHGADRPRRLAAIIQRAGSDFAWRLLPQLHAGELLLLIDAAESHRDAEWIVRHLSERATDVLLSEVRQTQPQETFQRRSQAFLSIRQANMTATDPRQSGWHRPTGIDTFHPGLGRRVVEEVDGGRWIHIEEVTQGPFGPKRVVADVLEFDPSQVRLRCVSTPRAERLTIAECAELFPLDSAPDEAAFRKARLFRLHEKAQAEGALAAINGNFYFDYGHFENAPRLGIDCARLPGLHFGDPVGWYVEDGQEYTPPVLNRCALVMTEDGRPWIQRTKMTSLTVGGEVVSWHVENHVPANDELAVFTSIWGQQTLHSQHIDYSIQENVVQGVHPGGGALIPLTGFVLSVPEGHTRLHELLLPGAKVQVHNNFPKERGKVAEAMACGPQLVRNGNVEIDFALEEFGTKDSSVMSFFLPRLVDRYEAARSFVAITESGSLLLGSVSGRAFGLGGADQPSGMTFGEVARLARDLGAHDAMGLDGGGSSSIIARHQGDLSLLNVPTGGADVPRGKERFIANAIMVHRRDRE